jgi:hypothetical protein
MKLFAGLSRTDYEDVLRAVGALIDERGWSNISLMEVDEGLIVQVLARPSLRQARPHLETYLLTDGDLERVQQDAVRRRKKRDAPPPATPQPIAPPEPSPALLPAPNSTSSRPAPSRLVEDRLASLVAQGREGRAPQSPVSADEEPPLPPLPALHGLPTERSLGMVEEFDESVFFPQTAALDSPDDDAPIFAPEPMRFTAVPTPPAYDPGAARAAVVMAHIVAARIKSGVPLTSDDPDLASLLEQVRALDELGIGKG